MCLSIFLSGCIILQMLYALCGSPRAQIIKRHQLIKLRYCVLCSCVVSINRIKSLMTFVSVTLCRQHIKASPVWTMIWWTMNPIIVSLLASVLFIKQPCSIPTADVVVIIFTWACNSTPIFMLGHLSRSRVFLGTVCAVATVFAGLLKNDLRPCQIKPRWGPVSQNTYYPDRAEKVSW